MLGLLPGIMALWISSRQSQLFECNFRKIDVGQLRTSGELEASAGIVFFSPEFDHTRNNGVRASTLCGTTDR